MSICYNLYSVYSIARAYLWSTDNIKQYRSEYRLLLFRYICFYIMHGFMLYTLFIDSRLYVYDELITMWPSICGQQILSVEHCDSSTSPASAYSYLLVLFWISSWPCGKVVMQRSHVQNIFPPWRNSVEAAMQKSQGCLSVLANRDLLHQRAVC